MESAPSFKFPNAVKHEVRKKIPVVFKYNVKSVKEVFLIGSFTNWKEKIQMVKRFPHSIQTCVRLYFKTYLLIQVTVIMLLS